MADEDYTDLPTEEQLPVPAIAIATYRHLWRYKWPYLGQLAIWTILAWIVNKPTRLVSGVLTEIGFVLPVASGNLVPPVVAEVTWLLCLTIAGGLIFLSCGCAILFGRRPRTGDAIRLPAVRHFWRAMFLFWLAAELIPACALQILFIYFKGTSTLPSWLTPLTWRIGSFAYPIAVWVLIGLALPIAAFQSAALPFADAWRRMHGNRGNMLALYLLTTLPVIAVQACVEYARWSTVPITMLLPSGTGWRMLFAYGPPIGDFLSLLLFLVLAACTMHVYARLESDSDELTQVFD
jgi:hypothetical protein